MKSLTILFSLFITSILFGILNAHSSRINLSVEILNPFNDSLPIHGFLNQHQINLYYPHLLDTIQDLRVILAEPLEIQPSDDFYSSRLINTATFDQSIICTHDLEFNLIDNHYIGKSTMFDKTSHRIRYEILNDSTLRFHHVDWGWIKKDSVDQIDTTAYKSYVLTITRSGQIIKSN